MVPAAPPPPPLTPLAHIRRVAGVSATVGALLSLEFLRRGFAGRDAYLTVAERAEGIFWWLVALPLSVYAFACLVALWDAPRAGSPAPPSPALSRLGARARSRLERVMLAVTLALGLLATYLVSSADRSATDTAGLYDALRAHVGTPWMLTALAVGSAVTAVHVFFGVEGFAARVLHGRRIAERVAPTAAVLVAAAFWFSFVNVTAYYGTGLSLGSLLSRPWAEGSGAGMETDGPPGAQTAP